MQQPGEKPVTLEAVMGLLRDGALRRFRIDIETDSTVVGDESQEKQDRTEFIASVTQMVQAWGPIVAQAPPMLPLFGQLLTFGVRAFRVGRELEEVIEDALEQMEEILNAPKPPPPQMEAEKIKADTARVKADAEVTKAKMGIEQTMLNHDVKMREIDRKEAAAQAEFERSQVMAVNQAMVPQRPGDV
jgi:hypothetical protein